MLTQKTFDEAVFSFSDATRTVRWCGQIVAEDVVGYSILCDTERDCRMWLCNFALHLLERDDPILGPDRHRPLLLIDYYIEGAYEKFMVEFNAHSAIHLRCEPAGHLVEGPGAVKDESYFRHLISRLTMFALKVPEDAVPNENRKRVKAKKRNKVKPLKTFKPVPAHEEDSDD